MTKPKRALLQPTKDTLRAQLAAVIAANARMVARQESRPLARMRRWLRWWAA